MIGYCKLHGPFSGDECQKCREEPTGEQEPVPPSGSVVAGQDLAKHRDYSTYVSLRIQNKVARIERLQQWNHCDYAIVQADTVRYCQEDRVRMLGVDQGNAGEPIVENYQRMGLMVEPVLFTLRSKNDMMTFTRALLQRKIAGSPPYFALPARAQNPLVSELKKQLKQEERIVRSSDIPRYDHPAGSHNDMLWALNIACWMSRPWMTSPIWAIQATPKPFKAMQTLSQWP